MNRPGRLEITTRIGCKCNCIYCPQELLVSEYINRMEVKNPATVMTLETFKACIDKLPKGTRIDFSGMAEPWLNADCTKMVLYAYEKEFPIAIYSTLVGMTQGDFEQIRDIPCEEFVVHIPDEKSNAHIDVTQEYIGLLEQVMMYQQPDGKRLVTGVSCHAGIHPVIKDAVPEDSKLITEIHNRAGNVEGEYAESKKSLGEIICINCGTELHHNVLLPDGTLLLCCMDYGMKHVLGNLLAQSYDEILKSVKVKRMQKGLKDDTKDILCRKCVNARNIYELYDEYALYLNWTRNLLVSSEKQQKDLAVYKDWVSKLEVQKTKMENVYKDWISKLEAQKAEVESIYKDWVNKLETQNAELREQKEELEHKNKMAENKTSQILEQKIRLEEKCCGLEQN